MAERCAADKVYREVLVVPLAARREALALILVICLIVVLMAFRFSLVGSVESGDNMRTYQQSDLYLKNQAPTLYRALLGSATDILELYEENGDWPDVTVLQSEALPPFEANFLPMGLRCFIWQRHASEGWVDYFGVNGDVSSAEGQGADPLENSFILRIIDLKSGVHPHPHLGKDNDPSMRFTYQIWMNPQISEYPGEQLVERGWKWVVSAGSSQGENANTVISEQPGQ
jgi:hypothetical protein